MSYKTRMTPAQLNRITKNNINLKRKAESELVTLRSENEKLREENRLLKFELRRKEVRE